MAQSVVVVGILVVSFGFALMVERALLGGLIRVMGRPRDGWEQSRKPRAGAL